MAQITKFFILFVCLFWFVGCLGIDLGGIKDSISISLSPPERKPIDRNLLGINCFFNDLRFGSQKDQGLEIQNKLKINHVRVLFRWDNNAQPSPNHSLNYNFYDSVLSSIPANTHVLVILDGAPDWINQYPNPRDLVVNNFIIPVVSRYKNNPKIYAWQIWNEPNNPSFIENEYIDVLDSSENYFQLLSAGSSAIRTIMPHSLVTNAATTSIIQNFPKSLNYNIELKEMGAEALVDAWSFHFYGDAYKNVVGPGENAENFLNSILKPKWVTESGAKGIHSQLEYGERSWPFLAEKINNLERIYIYQYSEDSPADSTYGLKNPDPSFGLSDLYIHLRDT